VQAMAAEATVVVALAAMHHAAAQLLAAHAARPARPRRQHATRTTGSQRVKTRTLAPRQAPAWPRPVARATVQPASPTPCVPAWTAWPVADAVAVAIAAAAVVVAAATVVGEAAAAVAAVPAAAVAVAVAGAAAIEALLNLPA